MDEINLGGKIYISTRRAAKEYKYHSDYLGQLVRAGKLDGHKVGRSWYILNDSMKAFIIKDAQLLAEKLAQHEYVPIAPIMPRPTPVPVVPHITRMPAAPPRAHDDTMLTYARSKKEEAVEAFMSDRRPVESYRAVEDRVEEAAEAAAKVRTLPAPPPVPISRAAQMPRSGTGKNIAAACFLAAVGAVVFVAAMSYALNINLVWPR